MADLTHSEFPDIRLHNPQALVAAAGSRNATISVDGTYKTRPDVAIVVFGEDPYAEFQGDIPDLTYRDKTNSLELLKQYRAAGIRAVSVFLSGRPLWVNPWLNQSDAFVAAWLPGSEGGGVADVLFGKADFKGKLPFSWPKRAMQFLNNVGDKDYDPQFAYGYGLSYTKPGVVGMLSENSGVGGADQPVGTWFANGKVGGGLILKVGAIPVSVGPAKSAEGILRSVPADRNAQEDSRRFVWSGTGTSAVVLASKLPLDIGRESNGALAIEIDVRVDRIGPGPVLLSMDDAAGIDIGASLRSVQSWQTISVPLACFARRGLDMTKVRAPFRLSSAALIDLSISRIELGSSAIGLVHCD